jgi:hypothetical protein
LPLATQVQLVEALEAAHVEPSSPAWLLFSVVAELIKELEYVRKSVTDSIHCEAREAARELRASVHSAIAEFSRREDGRRVRALVRYRRLDRVVVVTALCAMLLAFILAIR